MTKDIQHLLAFVIESKDAINEEERRVRFVISSDKIDRDNERIETSAITEAIKDFAKNPAALACHLHRLGNGKSPVIGSWDTDSFKALAHSCEMDLVFAETDLGEDYWKLYKDRHMRAVSIGFIPQEWHEEKDKNDKIWVITKLELLEISCVAVGSNRQALSKIKEFLGQPHDSDTLAKDTAGEITKSLTDHTSKLLGELSDNITEQFDEIKSLLIPESEQLAKDLLGKSFEQFDSGGEKQISEQSVVSALENVTQKFKDNDNDRK